MVKPIYKIYAPATPKAIKARNHNFTNNLKVGA